MGLIRIFRIQNDQNVGCVWGDKKLYKYPTKLTYDYSHLLSDGTERKMHPDADIGTDLCDLYFSTKGFKANPEYIFGFATVSDLYIWFSPVDIAWYELNEYYIYIYELDEKDVIFGTRQVAFNKNNVKSKKKIKHQYMRHLK